MQSRHLPRPDLWVGAFMIIIIMGTALVSPLYPLYQRAWDLTAGEVTRLYVVYMVGALASLLMLGRLADQFGYRYVMAAALVLDVIGTVLSMAAPGYTLFCFGRFLIGIAVSLSTTSGTVGVVSLVPERLRSAAPLMVSLFVGSGFAVGPVLGGFVGEWAEHPLLAAHVPSIVLLAGALVALFFLPAVPGRSTFSVSSLIPRLSWTTPENTVRLALACCFPFLGFGIFGFYASVSPMLIRNFTGLSGPAVTGLYIGTFLVCALAVQFGARGIPTRKAAVTAALLMAVGNLVMAVNLRAGSMVLFVGGVVIAAIGHGLCFLSSTTVLHECATVENRGGLTATYWAIGYSGSIFPLMLLGLASDRFGTEMAVTGFCSIIVALCLLVALLAWLRGSAR